MTTYFGNVNLDGSVGIFNQDGVRQRVRYTDEFLPPHKTYTFDNNTLVITDENGQQIGDPIQLDTESKPRYFKHNKFNP